MTYQPNTLDVEAATERLRTLLREHGLDPDARPTTHDGKAARDLLLFGGHFDRIDPDTGEKRCLDHPEQIVYTGAHRPGARA